VTDDTAYVQDFIDKGEKIPAGVWNCPDGLTIPADYIERAVAAGRRSDDGARRYLLGPLEGCRLELGNGIYAYPGFLRRGDEGTPGDRPLELGRNDTAVWIPFPPPLIPEDWHVSRGAPSVLSTSPS
jgi:hypothetical protein